MAKKITTQMLAETLLQRGWDPQQVQPFIDAFFKTLADAVTSGEAVKVKGLGTFKTIKVADRASVNVNTGERIVIPGHNKLKFVEEDKVNAVLNGAELVEPTPVPKKKPIRKASAAPIAPSTTSSDSPSSALPSTPQATPAALASSLSSNAESEPKKSHWWLWASIALAVVFVAICLASILSNNSVGESSIQAEPQTNSNPAAMNHSTQIDGPAYKVHVSQKGESLTTISILHYNTTDSVPRIMQLTDLTDTTSIPLRAELMLP